MMWATVRVAYDNLDEAKKPFARLSGLISPPELASPVTKTRGHPGFESNNSHPTDFIVSDQFSARPIHAPASPIFYESINQRR